MPLGFLQIAKPLPTERLSFLNGFDSKSLLVAVNWASNNIFLGGPVAQVVEALMIVSEDSTSSLCIRPATSSSRGDRLQCHDLQFDSQEPGARMVGRLPGSDRLFWPETPRPPFTFCPSATYGQWSSSFTETNLSFLSPLRMILTSHDYDVLCLLDRDQSNKVSVPFTLLGLSAQTTGYCFDTHVLSTLGPS